MKSNEIINMKVFWKLEGFLIKISTVLFLHNNLPAFLGSLPNGSRKPQAIL
jgi:hypothetical protein